MKQAQNVGADLRTRPPQNHDYRTDIDGLRALAVMPVVLFHASVRGFSGGFVGVDIFFVISGYLITGILVRDIASGRHSIANFYRRRILRIFPALAALMLATMMASMFLLMPVERDSFAKSLVSTALFVSNIQFYLSTDYFNLGATSQPLLHTWSLAVEEQWYILWPVFLAAIGAHRAGVQRGVAAAITLLSLVLSIWLLPIEPAATFYLLPTRAWELGLGAMLAMWAYVPSARVAQLLGAIGVGMIGASVKMYTHETAFPGLAALPPCLGAALIILSGRSPTVTARALSLAPVQWIGRISYSLYLWHWPVIVFAETGLLLRPSPAVSVGMVGASILFAWVSYRFVEQPFRHGIKWKTQNVLFGGAGMIAATLMLAAVAPVLSERANPFTPLQAATAEYLQFDGDSAYRRNVCFQVGPRGQFSEERCLRRSLSRPSILLVGDSHAAHLWPGFAEHLDELDVLQATSTGCVAGVYPDPKDFCQRFENSILKTWLSKNVVAAVILSSHWHWSQLFELEATLNDSIVRRSNPILVGPTPEYATGLPRILVWANKRADAALVGQSLDSTVFALDSAMRQPAMRTGTIYVSMTDELCPVRKCNPITSEGAPLFFDSNHFTMQGSKYAVGRAFRNAIQKMAAPQRPR